YRTASLVVARSRGERFGLPLAEAMRLGIPVVTTGYSGQVDFCTPSTAWLVDYHMAPSLAHVSGSLSLWAEPSTLHLGAQMRAALDNE
ncbi:glycosyltransferase family 4 protein, partial [Mycobacterium tuberculosis]|nr:glycosyltransferase family 4 protein [Mycobacterium tuberculosis]